MTKQKTSRNIVKSVLSLPKRFLVSIGNGIIDLGNSTKKSPRKLYNFSRSAVAELRNVEWLSRKETFRYSAYVLGFMILGALFIALLDTVFYESLRIVLGI